MGSRQRNVRLWFTWAKALLVAGGLLLLMAYFGAHVREAGGAFATTAL